jgi:hypothetical protein
MASKITTPETAMNIRIARDGPVTAEPPYPRFVAVHESDEMVPCHCPIRALNAFADVCRYSLQLFPLRVFEIYKSLEKHEFSCRHRYC